MRVLSVAEVTEYIRDVIELDPILSELWIRGEVTNFSRSSAGHMYFCLVSEGVQINCVLFRGSQAGVLAMPRNGDEVLAHGRISIYESRGQYQLMVDNVAPEGIGVLQLQFEKTRRRLEADGLFAIERKRQLPRLPRAIGVVTSAQGAVWHDIQTVVERRFPLVELILAPSAVQGPDAPDELIDALERLQADGRCDVIIIGRGGGAAEDLACFSDERLARAIYCCRVPVVSAVGHETDTCIADLVADIRAPTPSAAAELCVPDGREMLARAGALVTQARSCAVQSTSDARSMLAATQSTIKRHSPRNHLDRARQDVDDAFESVSSRLADAMAERRLVIESAQRHAALLNPRDVLRRGYAIVSTTDGCAERRIASAADARASQYLVVSFADGRVGTTVTGDES